MKSNLKHDSTVSSRTISTQTDRSGHDVGHLRERIQNLAQSNNCKVPLDLALLLEALDCCCTLARMAKPDNAIFLRDLIVPVRQGRANSRKLFCHLCHNFLTDDEMACSDIPPALAERLKNANYCAMVRHFIYGHRASILDKRRVYLAPGVSCLLSEAIPSNVWGVYYTAKGGSHRRNF